MGLQAVSTGMSVTSICQICNRATAEHDCRRCGALVCDQHYDHAKGVCADCAGGIGMGT